MSEFVVQQIYDELYNLESRVRKGDAYPIHKKLVFHDEVEIDDIYGWLAKTIDFNEGDVVLDAGCGVGYGTCLLAGKHNINIQGISLSKKEVEKAKKFSEKLGIEDRVSFQRQSFDTLKADKFDKIIAVESIKHAVNLSQTLSGFVDALHIGGSLYIVEDFYAKQDLVPSALKYKKDWNLTDVFRLSDYYAILDKDKTDHIDLTHYMPSKSSFRVNLKLFLTNFMNVFRSTENMDVNRIFRGGYYLDRLYLDGLMRYGVLVYTK